MAGRVQQDVFIDDSDDTCPLCVEEFDLSDRNFKPCPCGYKVCQFCFNNIRNNLNGLCPACRRPYDDKTIEWKVVSPEEFKADLQQQARKKAAARQKEAQKREVETQNRKHLSGLRVVQKNLVYVVGLNPKIREEDLLQTLRGEQYFGQYGKIVKIVVSKAKDGSHPNHSLGVYVTFATKQDAATCIAAVDGSQNGDRVLRAQYGTTKYCSAYLRNEQCMNKNCMFLHEPGEDNESFTRQDLSSMNVVSTQRPGQSSNLGGPQPQPPPQQAPQTIAAATTMSREMSREGTRSPAEIGDGSALPATVNWATKQQGRRISQPTSGAAPSPRAVNASIASQGPQESSEQYKPSDRGESTQTSEPATPVETPAVPTVSPETPSQQVHQLLRKLLKSVCSPTFKFNFAEEMFSPEELEAMKFLPLFDENGGIKRRAIREQEEKDRQELEEEENRTSLQETPAPEFEETTGSGSLQLGGEPDVQPGSEDVAGESMAEPRRQVIQPPQQAIPTTSAPGFTSPFPFANNISNLTVNGRSLTPLQQQQLLLLRSGNTQAGNILDQYSQNLGLAQATPSNAGLFQNQQQHLAAAQGHTRHSSRFTFANDSASASASVKPAANAKLMAQQSSMMPTNAHQLSQQISQHQPLGQFHGTTVQGPPPGLKSTGTPPVTGGGMFGQGHGFANTMSGGLGYGSANVPPKENSADLMRELIRGRSATSSTGTGQFDAAKHEHDLRALTTASPSMDALMSGGLLGASVQSPFGPVDYPSGRPTPPVPPGLNIPQSQILAALSGNDNNEPSSAAKSRSSTPLSATAAVPVIPASTASGTLSSKKESKAVKTSASAKSTDENHSTVSTATATPTLASQKGAPRSSTDTAFGNEPKSSEEQRLSLKKTAKEDNVRQSVEKPQDDKSGPEASKRQHPGKLDISAATKVASKDMEAPAKAETPIKKAGRSDSAAAIPPAPAPSRPETPSAAGAQRSESPAIRQSQPRTLRVVPTPKTETPPPVPTASAIALGNFIARQPSRQPSVASLQRPDTPASEMISDTASVVSASVSRASSPPPSKVGTAPVRSTTKSQQKKQRQERARQAELTKRNEDSVGKPAEEPIQAPIVGRKKKVKKPSSNSANESAQVSRTNTPTPKEKAKDELDNDSKVAPPQQTKQTPSNNNNHNVNKENSKATNDDKPAPAAAPSAAAEPQAPQKPTLTAASIIADLQAAGEIDVSKMAFFQPLIGLGHRFDISPDELLNLDTKVTISNEDQAKLAEGHPIRIPGKPGVPSSRVLISAGGCALRGLNDEQENRFLELEDRIMSSTGPARYVHARHGSAGGSGDTRFSMIGGRVVQNTSPGYTPGGQSGLSSHKPGTDPTSKVRVDEALGYINQYVMPALPSTNKLDKSVTAQTLSDFGLRMAGEEGRSFRAPDPASLGIPLSTAGALPSMPLLNPEEAEAALIAARKETEALEKKLNALIKRNRRLGLGPNHAAAA